MGAVKSNKRILVLDKDSRLVDPVDDVLAGGGWDVQFTYDPNAVFDLAKANRPDLVILDFLLLDSECKTICDDFRSDPDLQSVPIMVVTRYKTRKTSQAAYQCDALFVKPVDVGIVASHIDYLMAS